MNKKIIALVCLAALVLALMAGCGTAASSQSGSQEPVSSAPAASAPAAEPTEPTETDAEPEAAYFPLAETEELSIWFCYPPFITDYIEGPEEYLIYEEAQKRLNLDLVFTGIPIPAARDNLNIMLASGDMTDLVLGMFGNYSGSPASCVEQELIVDLTDYIAQYAPNYTAVLASNENYRKQCSTDDGRQLLFYYIESQEGYLENYGAVIRQDWLDELEMDTPVTYDDYYEVLTAFKTEIGVEGALWLPHMGCTDGSFLGAGLNVCTENYADKYKPFYCVDGEVKYGMVEDEYLDYLTLLNTWFEEKLIYQDFMSDSTTYMYPADNIPGSSSIGVWHCVAKNIDSYAAIIEDKSFVLAPVPNPVQNEGDTLHLSAGGGAYAKIGSATAVTTSCDDLELAVRYLDWWFSDEAYILANYGVEGVSYNKTADGGFEFTDIIMNNEAGQNVALTLYTGATSGASFLFDNTKYELLYSETQMAACADVWRSNTDGAWDLPAIALTAEETEEFNELYADIQTYITENTVKFITGERSLDEYDEFVQWIKDMDIDRCIEIYQAACDRYASR